MQVEHEGKYEKLFEQNKKRWRYPADHYFSEVQL